MMCDKQESLVGYLYDEVSGAEKREIEGHLAICAECRIELEGLRGTRLHLAQWAPPEPDLGFRVVGPAAMPVSRVAAPMRFAPAFAFAAAAVLVLAAAASIANLELRYGSDGVSVRTGWGRAEVAAQQTAAPGQSAASTQATTAPVIATAATVAQPVDIEMLEQRLRQLEAAAAARGGEQRTTQQGGMSDAAVLRQVREMVTDAESRQRIALAQGLMQVINDFDRMRRADLAALQQGIGQYQGVANAEIAQTRDMVNQLMRVAKQER